jgi:DNA-binding winged helix-turn-helix (wHTH) protein
MEDSESRVRFGPFTLDVHAMELRKFDHRIRLRPQALTLLIHLVTRAGDLVTREELRGRLWGEDTFVDFEHGLNFCIRQIRRALGESAASPRFIETVPRRGYRFLSPSSRIRSLAVLPFDNLSRDPELQYLVDGIPEGLIRKLALFADLRVMAWSSVSRLKSGSAASLAFGRKFGVGAILTGAVRSREGILEVGVDLIDTSNGSEIWGSHYQLGQGEIVDLQQTLVAEVSRALHLGSANTRVPSPESTSPNVGAFHCWLKGRHHLNKASEEGLRRSILHFNEAINLDPLHALAFTGLAESYGLLGFFGFMHPRDSWPKAKAAAFQAIQIDDKIAEAHASLAMATLFYDWQPVAAQTYCHRATKLSPSSSAGRRCQACCFMALGRYDESVAAATEALELDPLSPLAHILISTAHYFGRRYDLALAEANKALEFDPHHAESHRFKGITLLQLDELEKAIPELETALRLMGEGPATLGSLGRAYARAGRLWFAAELRLQLATQWGF